MGRNRVLFIPSRRECGIKITIEVKQGKRERKKGLPGSVAPIIGAFVVRATAQVMKVLTVADQGPAPFGPCGLILKKMFPVLRSVMSISEGSGNIAL